MQEQHKASLWDVLWENAIGGIAIVDRDGVFIRANPAFCRIVEYSEPELQKKTFKDISMPSDVSVDEELSAETAAGRRKSYDLIKSYITKTGRLVWVHLRVVPFEVNGEFHYFISQVFEVPVSIIRQMGVSVHEEYNNTYKLDKVVPSFNWGKYIKMIRDWVPLVIAGLIGGGYIISQIAQHFPS